MSKPLMISLRPLTSPAIMFFALPWLMLLLVLGTVAQRYIGLYASQKLFFGSYILWVGLFPLPGAYSTLALIATSLTAKLLLKSPVTRRRSGTLLVHMSAVVLLLGGLITAWLREDGYMVLADGDSARTVTDYRLRNLTIEHEGKTLLAIPFASLREGEDYRASGTPFTLHILQNCFPCSVRPRTQIPSDARGAAQKMELFTVPYSREDAKNIGGVELSIRGAQADGTYLAYEGLTAPEAITAGNDHYTIALKPAERMLPFSVKLVHFTKSDYPGTDEARAYRSDVTVEDEGLKWNAAIEMNQPLRYKGYTFYQSSFIDDGGRMMGVLAVVKNAGAWFPYIAVSMLCIGLCLHVCIMLRRKETV